MPTLEELTQGRSDVQARAEEIIQAIDGVPTPEQAEQLGTLNTQFEDFDGQLRSAEQATGIADKFRSRAGASQGATSAIYGGGEGGPGAAAGEGEQDQAVTPGELFLRSQAYGDWIGRFPNGGPAVGTEAQSGSMEYDQYRNLLGMPNATEKLRGFLSPMKARALITSADASAGHLVRPDFRGLLEPYIGYRPLTIRQLVTVIPVATDAIEYVVEATRVSNAAPVAESTALNSTVVSGQSWVTAGTKPEGGLTFAPRSDTVRTIAEWVAATRRILSDAPALRTYIDQYLTDDIAIELEDQMIAGGGGGENFTGILNTVGIQTAGPPGVNASMLDVIRTAKRLVRINARTNATAVLVNPVDGEAIDLLKWGSGATASGYQGQGPYGASDGPGRIWGIPYVESEAVPAGTALVGDFRRAVLFDREQTNISVGTANDDFLRNIVRVLAEMRAGFGVIRPSAFVAVDLVA